MTIRPLAIALLVACSAQAQANIDIQFDFTYDTADFFSSNAGSMAALDAAAAVFESRLADSLTAITSSGGNSFGPNFFNPSDPDAEAFLLDQTIAANVIRVYAGGYNFTDDTLGMGGPGGYGCSGFGSFCDDAARRGQGETQNVYDNGVLISAAVDVAPWGGSISFDSAGTDWHFGTTTAGLDSSKYDFYSVAVHELAHLLGFGLSNSFSNLSDLSFDTNGFFIGGNFVGTNAGVVALDDPGHWLEGTQSLVNGVAQEAAMDPTIVNGERKYFTELDFAAMQDIGWEVTPVPEADTWAMLLAGLGLVGFAARRRMA